MRALGASVTLPHKLARRRAVRRAVARGARDRRGQLPAVRRAARRAQHRLRRVSRRARRAPGSSSRGKRVVLLGAGGAARAVAYGCADGARGRGDRAPARGGRAGRRRGRGPRASARLLRARATSSSTARRRRSIRDRRRRSPTSLPLDALPPDAWVATLVYHRRTNLLERASERGHSTLDGRAMLVHQGARAFTIWTGVACSRRGHGSRARRSRWPADCTCLVALREVQMRNFRRFRTAPCAARVPGIHRRRCRMGATTRHGLTSTSRTPTRRITPTGSEARVGTRGRLPLSRAASSHRDRRSGGDRLPVRPAHPRERVHVPRRSRSAVPSRRARSAPASASRRSRAST